MKKLVVVALLLQFASSSRTMETPKKQPHHQCSTKCVNVCQEVKTNHSNLLNNLQQSLEMKKKWGNACGKPCNHIKTDGLENLFKEEETQVPVVTLKQAVKLSTSSGNLNPKKNSDYTDIDILLSELEKDLPQPQVPKKLTLIDYAKEITALIRRAGSQTLFLLKPESTEADKNNLDDTCRQLEEKNNILPDIIGAATESEKNQTEFLRLSSVAIQAAESVERLGLTKQPLIDCADDFTHPFNSYKNEIKLLQRLLTPKK